MDNQIMVYLYNGILFGSKKEQRPDSHNMNNMMVSRMRKKNQTQEHIWYGSVLQSSVTGKNSSIMIEIRTVVSRRKWEWAGKGASGNFHE